MDPAYLPELYILENATSLQSTLRSATVTTVQCAAFLILCSACVKSKNSQKTAIY